MKIYEVRIPEDLGKNISMRTVFEKCFPHPIGRRGCHSNTYFAHKQVMRVYDEQIALNNEDEALKNSLKKVLGNEGITLHQMRNKLGGNTTK